MANEGKLASEFVEVFQDQPTTGRLASEFVEVFQNQAATGRISSEFVEVFQNQAATGRLGTQFVEVFRSFLVPVASVPDITGGPSLPATFDSSASTDSFGGSSAITNRLWSWTSVPGGSAITNITPTPMPDGGGTSFISMANNAVLYHCEGNGTDSSPVVPPSPAPMPDNGGTTFVSMANNAVLYHCEGGGADSSGNGNTATFTSITAAVAGKIGSFAWSFNAENARASLTTPVVLGANWTIAFWFYDLDGDGTWREAVQDAAGAQIHISISPGNLLGVYIGGHTSSGFTMNAANYTGWHHMVAVGSGTTTAFYVDGVYRGTAAAKATANVQYIGTTFSERFAARMDEIAIWTRALSAAEAEALWFNQVGTITGNTATFSNVTTGAVGKVGSFAWSYATASAYATLTSAVSLAGDHTVACWFYNLGPDNAYRSLVLDNPATRLFLVEATTTLLGVWNGASLASCGFSMPAASYTGWHHIAVVCGGATTDFYVDGVYVGTSAIRMSTNIKHFGGSTAPNQRFAERLDEVAVWTRVLSAAEILTLYANQSGNHAGTGTTLNFTPDVTGTYTVQYSQGDSNIGGTYIDSANAEVIRVSDLGVWPMERLEHPPGIQGGNIRRRRGQM